MYKKISINFQIDTDKYFQIFRHCVLNSIVSNPLPGRGVSEQLNTCYSEKGLNKLIKACVLYNSKTFQRVRSMGRDRIRSEFLTNPDIKKVDKWFKDINKMDVMDFIAQLQGDLPLLVGGQFFTVDKSFHPVGDTLRGCRRKLVENELRQALELEAAMKAEQDQAMAEAHRKEEDSYIRGLLSQLDEDGLEDGLEFTPSQEEREGDETKAEQDQAMAEAHQKEEDRNLRNLLSLLDEDGLEDGLEFTPSQAEREEDETKAEQDQAMAEAHQRDDDRIIRDLLILLDEDGPEFTPEAAEGLLDEIKAELDKKRAVVYQQYEDKLTRYLVSLRDEDYTEFTSSQVEKVETEIEAEIKAEIKAEIEAKEVAFYNEQLKSRMYINLTTLTDADDELELFCSRNKLYFIEDRSAQSKLRLVNALAKEKIIDADLLIDDFRRGIMDGVISQLHCTLIALFDDIEEKRNQIQLCKDKICDEFNTMAGFNCTDDLKDIWEKHAFSRITNPSFNFVNLELTYNMFLEVACRRVSDKKHSQNGADSGVLSDHESAAYSSEGTISDGFVSDDEVPPTPSPTTILVPETLEQRSQGGEAGGEVVGEVRAPLGQLQFVPETPKIQHGERVLVPETPEQRSQGGEADGEVAGEVRAPLGQPQSVAETPVSEQGAAAVGFQETVPSTGERRREIERESPNAPLSTLGEVQPTKMPKLSEVALGVENQDPSAGKRLRELGGPFTPEKPPSKRGVGAEERSTGIKPPFSLENGEN